MTDRPGRIFGRGDEFYGNAIIGPVANPWELYTYGFGRAAEILLEHVETRHTSLDVIVFPIVFLYRHQLELAIKLVDRDARQLLGRPSRDRPEHRLRVLWDETKKLIVAAEGVMPEGLDPIDSAVAQFHDLDPSSTAFRYPEGFDQSTTLPGVSNINLLTLRESLEPAFVMLNAAHETLKMSLEHD